MSRLTDLLASAKAKDPQLGTDLDPHGFQFADSLPKLKGLARYAEAHPQAFRRIEAVAKVGDQLRVLNLLREDVREAISAAANAEALYRGTAAVNYP